MKVVALFLAVLAVSVAAIADEPPSVASARALFDSYIKLGHSFDPRVADLYSDEARIQNRRTYPDGNVKTLTLPASEYKQLIRSVMPVAKARGDLSTYSDVRFAEEGDAVRITAKRYSELKKYTSPLSILVRKAPSGVWEIVEELSESRP